MRWCRASPVPRSCVRKEYSNSSALPSTYPLLGPPSPPLWPFFSCKDKGQERRLLPRALMPLKDCGGQRGHPQDAWAVHAQRTPGLRLHLPSRRWKLRLLPFSHRISPEPLSGSHISDTSLLAPRDAQLGAVWGTFPLNPLVCSRDLALFPLPWGRGRLFVLPLLIFLKQYVIALAADPPLFLPPLPHMSQRSAPFISLRFTRCKGLRLPCCPSHFSVTG